MPLKGSCHCRAIQFEIESPPGEVTACTCSFCSKRGALWAYYAPEQFRLTTSPRRVASYQWGAFMMEHFHCAICGCATHGVGPEWVDFQPHPTRRRINVNARLLDDFDLAAAPVRLIDGKNLW